MKSIGASPRTETPQTVIDDPANNKGGSYGLVEKVDNHIAVQNDVIGEKILVTTNDDEEVSSKKIMNVDIGYVNLEVMVKKSLGGAGDNSKGKELLGSISQMVVEEEALTDVPISKVAKVGLGQDGLKGIKVKGFFENRANTKLTSRRLSQRKN